MDQTKMPITKEKKLNFEVLTTFSIREHKTMCVMFIFMSMAQVRKNH
jgi:hypothetical protein